MGIKGATVPIFAAENSPAPIRGALGAYELLSSSPFQELEDPSEQNVRLRCRIVY